MYLECAFRVCYLIVRSRFKIGKNFQAYLIQLKYRADTISKKLSERSLIAVKSISDREVTSDIHSIFRKSSRKIFVCQLWNISLRWRVTRILQRERHKFNFLQTKKWPYLSQIQVTSYVRGTSAVEKNKEFKIILLPSDYMFRYS